MNGKKARYARWVAHKIRERHKSEIAMFPWYKRWLSWLFPRLGYRWADKAIAEADAVDDFAERRTYRYIKRRIGR